MLDHVKIKDKLILAFLLIGLFSAVVGTFGLNALYHTNENTNHIYSEHFVPSTYLFTVQKNLLQINSSFLLMLYERDILQSEGRMETITALQLENQELLTKFEESGELGTQYDTLKGDLAAANQVMNEMGSLLLANNYTEAMNLAASFHSRINLVDRDIQNVIDEVIAISYQSQQESQTTFQSSFWAMIIISLLCLISAFIAGRVFSNKISMPIVDLSKAAEKLALGDVNVHVETKLRDELGDLILAFNKMTDNIKTQAAAAEKISDGDLSLEITPNSEEDLLGNSMCRVVSTLRALVEESEAMTTAASNGDLAYRGNEETFSGGYRDIIQGFNQTLEAVIVPLNTSADCLRQISRGDIPQLLTDEYPGDFNNIKESLNTCISAIKAMIVDVNMLSAAAVQGELRKRADTENHDGDFKEIVSGFNRTLDAVVNPLYIAAAYIKKIGEGQIPPKLTQNYHGEFNRIKNSINSCLEGLEALSEGNEMLNRMRLNDFTGQVSQNGQGIFKEISQSINEMSSNINEIIGYVNHVALGNLEDLEELKAIDRKSENDILIPSITIMIENLKDIVAETNQLSEAAIDGHLDKRGSTEKFQGEYKKIVEGINQTLDAVIEPIKEASSVLTEMSLGNLNVLMTGNYKGDHAEIKNAVNSSIQSLLNYIGEISEVLSEISRGNLDISITEEYQGNFIEIKDSLNNIIVSLNQVIRGIHDTAEDISSGSSQIMDSSQVLAQGSMEQACSIEELSASIAETAAHIRKNTDEAARASDHAVAARYNAQKGNVQMEGMLESMEKINDSSLNISKIIKVIDDIAFQTNILALNAAVEAARAGQHGKGFAVVADEVRRLAARSAEAAKKTTQIIEDSLENVQLGREIAKETAQSFHEILTTMEEVTNLVVNISEASKEQASSIVIINQGIEQVSEVVQKNSAMAEQSSAMSEKLYGEAASLTSMVADYQYREQLEILALPDRAPSIKLLESGDPYEMLCS